MTGTTETELLPRFRAGAALLLAVAVAAVLASSCGDRSPEHDRGGAAPDAQPAGTIEERLAARPAWLDPSDSLEASAFANDPHDFACAVCHDRSDKSVKEWKATCASAGCHFRPWPETVFHRVPLSVFNRCETCHEPHVFSLDGDDCASCHGNLNGPEGTVPVTEFTGIAEFPHARHAEFSCQTCHSVEGKHASLIVNELETCRSCHHAPVRRDECARCHAPSEISGPRSVPFTMTIASNAGPRRLPFDHATHEGLDCASCHAADRTRAPVVSCTDCHEYHHEPSSDCATCHRAPPAAAHTMDVHEAGCTGSGCHGEQGFAVMEFNRGFCMSCHTDRRDHFPQKNCEGCHKITETGHGGR